MWFITGAGLGMGLEFAKAALGAVHAVVASGRDSSAVSSAVGPSSDLLAVELDVTKRADAEAAVGAATKRFGRIDVLVNNAANFHAGHFEELTPEHFERQLSASFGIATTVVNPGFFRTELLTEQSTNFAAPSVADYDERRATQLEFWKSQNGQQPGDPAKLAPAVESALEQDAARRSERDEVRVLRARYETLTPREREVLAHVVAGRLNKQIAADVGMAERTVKAHRAQVMGKMQVGSVADLVRAASRLGLPPTPGSDLGS